jgi:NAD(P)-dependent dehydrogenase (short-subunit alcohol dehydrogenase family)
MTTVQTRSAAVEYGRYGIRVNAVSPSAVRSKMMLVVFGSGGALDQMGTFHPMGRIGRPEEIADAVAWLFSEKSSYYAGLLSTAVSRRNSHTGR